VTDKPEIFPRNFRFADNPLAMFYRVPILTYWGRVQSLILDALSLFPVSV
jgi:hypothetical protein